MDPVTASNDNLDSAKRQQILDGARRCFLALGFDAASMNDIVKAAGVSKGTVYAYFPSKEKLFEAMVYVDRRRSAEQVVVIYAGTHGYLDKLAVKDVGRFEKGLLAHLRSSGAGLLDRIRDQDQKIAGEIENEIKAAIESFAKTFA